MNIVVQDLQAHQLAKLPCDTRIVIQVHGAGTLFIGHEQGEVTNPSDGLQFTQASTAPPYDTIWQGEMWYRTDTPGLAFNIFYIGKVGVPAKGTASQGI